jgi:hypothetical protein
MAAGNRCFGTAWAAQRGFEMENLSCPTQTIKQAPAGIFCITPPLAQALLLQERPCGLW